MVNKKGLASLTHEYKIRAKNIKAVLNILPEVCRSYTGYHLPGIKKGTILLQLEYCRHSDFGDMSYNLINSASYTYSICSKPPIWR